MLQRLRPLPMLAGRPPNQLASQLAGEPTGELAGELPRRLADLLAGEQDGELAGEPADELPGFMGARRNARSVNSSYTRWSSLARAEVLKQYLASASSELQEPPGAPTGAG